MNRIVIAVVVLGGCVKSDSVECPDGTVCPVGSECKSLMIGADVKVLCATPELLCPSDGALCDVPERPGGGTCHGGVCLATVCGNQLVDVGEQCDDGNHDSNDGCSADCKSTEVCGNGAIDLLRGEQCDAGGDHVGHDGCSNSCRLEEAHWQAITAERPSPRRATDLAYDVHRHRVVLFGGNDVAGGDFADTYEWDGRRWRAGTPAAVPERRSTAAIAYDAARQRVTMFSGSSTSVDTWTWNGTEWTLLAPPMQPPTYRLNGRMAYDSIRKQLVLFGGLIPVAPVFANDTWLFDGTTWSAIAGASPPGRIGFGIAFDPHRGVTVLFGGQNAALLGDLWEFDGTAWTQKSFTGGPTARKSVSMAFDPVTQKMMVLGGTTLSTALNEVWEWDGTSWTALAPLPFTDPLATLRNGATTDSVRGKIVWLASNGTLYEYNGAVWQAPAEGTTLPTEPVPAAREAHTAVVDSARHEIVMYGGSTNHQASGSALNDTWTWTGAWRQQLVIGPPARWGHAMVYDPKHDATVLFGGCTAADAFNRCTAALGETWIWKNHTWTHPIPPMSPTARSNATLAWDAARQEVVLFGGVATTNTIFAETWTWNGTTWTLRAPATSPPRRYQAAMAYDPGSQRVVLFGGTGADLNSETTSDTWLWDGQTWTDATTANSPAPREETGLAFDAARGRLVLVGGRIGLRDTSRFQSVNDVWEWTGQSWQLVSVADDDAVSTGRYGHIVVSGLDGTGVTVFGGGVAGGNGTTGPDLNEMWRIQWDGDSSYETCGQCDADGDGLVACADPDCAWMCAPLSTCGDGVCNGEVEDCDSCPVDCNACAPRCGDLTCNGTETAATCPGDCP